MMPQAPYQPFYTYTLGLTDQQINARGGLRVQPTHSLATTPQPDILIVPGGYGARRLLKNDRLLQWLATSAPQCEIVASVCTGALVLAAAGLLNDQAVTTHHGAFDRLAELAPSCTVVKDERYTVSADRRTWCSGGISAGIDMSLGIVRHLLGDDKKVTDEMEWMWHMK
jgi:transcriptional regulator GlxA family with amidase domain